MPQHNKPTTMSPSEWRLWCCCRPAITPPSSSLSQRENMSLEEFDPRNRLSLSMSRDYGRRPSTPLPPSTQRKDGGTTPPPGAIRRAGTEPLPRQSERPRPKAEERSKPRPTTVLLPSPPQRPSESRGERAGKGEHSKPQFIRQDSENWWQVGKRMLERRDKNGSPRQESRERK